ncbi:MAG TPA: hypothetical protein VNK73_02625 [Actinomycetota bacterium]|jgi:hypothetical protein|nr:hypothetical protein [Actinomycetota bacterium]
MMWTVARRTTALVSMAVAVPLLLLCLAGPARSSSPMAAPRLGLIGLPGTEQAVLRDRSPLFLLVSVRRDDQSRIGPAALGRLDAVPGGAALRALARLAFAAGPGRAARTVAAEPRAPPAR